MALYRTYRPARLADVIGQPHITEPLARALDTGRAHHAYLFTGPRGCGKTSTARILARSLNCEKGPTSEPCGTCQSCRDLAPDGPGSIDVVEMDAATHGLVEDARDLREKAMFAPVASRYKVYIFDEAHQLSGGASNALLKLIEEPPPHLRFVFATTAPDKIISTIRSRTHQYPFRLVSLRRLQDHLAWVCAQEGVPAEPAALALAARAAEGSVRDALSILGQLIAGSGEAGLTYDGAAAQLGFTDVALLNQAVDALAAGDGAALFGVVDRVVEGGIDPRRFATDLLDRLRDLLVLHEVPGAIEDGLLDLPDEELDVVRRQGEALSLSQLSRAADLVSAGLSELKGATAPRLQLELLCARLLLPAADDSESGVLARLDRIESTVASLAVTGPLEATPSTTPPSVRRPAPAHTAPPDGEPAASGPVGAPEPDGKPAAPPQRPRTAPPSAPPAGSQPGPASGPPRRPAASAPRSDAGTTQPRSAGPEATGDAATATTGPDRAAATGGWEPAGAQETPSSTAGPSLQAIRDAWPGVLEALKQTSRVAYMEARDSVPMAIHGRRLVVGHPDPSVVKRLHENAGNLGRLALAVLDVVQAEVEIDLVLGVGVPGSTAEPGPGAGPEPSPGASAPESVDDETAPDDPEVADSNMAPLALIQRELGGNVVEEFDRPS